MNKTTEFVLPLLVDKKYANDIMCFLGINKLQDKLYDIYVKKTNNDIQIKFKDNENYKGKTIYKGNVFYILTIPEKYREDYEKIIIGNYSEIKLNTKRLMYSFWYNANKNIANIIFNTVFVFNDAISHVVEFLKSSEDENTENLKNAIMNLGEVNSIFNLQNEIFYTH